MSKVSLNNIPSNPRINRLRTFSRVSIIYNICVNSVYKSDNVKDLANIRSF